MYMVTRASSVKPTLSTTPFDTVAWRHCPLSAHRKPTRTISSSTGRAVTTTWQLRLLSTPAENLPLMLGVPIYSSESWTRSRVKACPHARKDPYSGPQWQQAVGIFLLCCGGGHTPTLRTHLVKSFSPAILGLKSALHCYDLQRRAHT